MSKLVLKGIRKNYGDKEALKGIDLELESGRIYGLIGRNGAGKTTLLSVMTAQSPASAGEVELDGERIWENRAILSRMCFSRELNVSAGSYLAAYKIKDYFRAARAYYPSWDEETERKLLEHYGLDVKKKLSKLSKGMLSMVTIIVAMASKAEFTFLDEPVAGLDVIAREEFYKMLLDEYAATGRTFVVSTHIIDEAASVLEEVLMLRDGELILRANTQELIESALHVSGSEAEVDRAAEGLRTYHTEHIGRSKSVTVFLREGESLQPGCDVTVQPISLQRIFVALCGEEAEV